MKILIVDDHPVLLEGLTAIFRQPDRTPSFSATDADAALGMLAEHPDIDIIILDLVMPGMGGLDAIAHFARKSAPTFPSSCSRPPRTPATPSRR